MDFGTEVTVITTAVNNEQQNDNNDDTFITGRQWVIIIAVGIILAVGIDLWLRASGL